MYVYLIPTADTVSQGNSATRILIESILMGRFAFPTTHDLVTPLRSKEAFITSLKTSQVIKAMSQLEMRSGPTKISNRHRLIKELGPGESLHDYNPHRITNGERYNLPLYWFSNQFSLVGWNTGSALVTVGLVSRIMFTYASATLS